MFSGHRIAVQFLAGSINLSIVFITHDNIENTNSLVKWKNIKLLTYFPSTGFPFSACY